MWNRKAERLRQVRHAFHEPLFAVRLLQDVFPCRRQDGQPLVGCAGIERRVVEAVEHVAHDLELLLHHLDRLLLRHAGVGHGFLGTSRMTDRRVFATFDVA